MGNFRAAGTSQAAGPVCARLQGMNPRRLPSLLARALTALALLAWGPQPVLAQPLGAGTHEQSLQHAGRERRYRVHVPQAVAPSTQPANTLANTPASPPASPPAKALPLVLAFHGGGGHAAFMADDDRYGLITQAERAGFVVVFPNGFSRLPGGRLATWNAGDCCGAARDQGSDDVGFVRALIAQLRRQLPLDDTRIFATGMSNGAMFSYRLACEMADTFRAVAAVAGTEALADCRPTRPVPLLHLHARNDSHVLFDGGAGPDAFHDRRQVMEFVSVPDTVARWVHRNHSRAEPLRSLERPGAWCDTYPASSTDPALSAPVRLCVTEGGGHSWPGPHRVRRGKEPASTALVAEEEIWRFFAEVSSSPR